MMKPLWFFVCAAFCAAPATVEAHAFLDTATPAVGSTLHQTPPMVRLHFTEALEPAFSTITVLDAAGHPVNAGKAVVDPADPTYLNLKLPPLLSGSYKVEWRVISVDTHPTQGNFSFQLVP